MKIDDYTAKCTKCSAKVSVKYEGKLALSKHSVRPTHQQAVQRSRENKVMDTFVTNLGTKTEDLVSRAELLSVYHSVRHGQSYNSLDCGNKLAPKQFSDSKIASQMSCARTKSEAITRGVLAPFTEESAVSTIKKAEFFAISSDASSHGNLKTFPLVSRYFTPEDGVSHKVLDFYEDSKEASADIFECIINVLVKHELSVEKVSGYSADNANVNFGRKNSVFQKLKAKNPRILKLDCKCHLIHNAAKKGSKCLSCDVECLVLKVFSTFSRSAKNLEALQEFSETADEEFAPLLKHVEPRWLSLLPAVKRVAQNFRALKKYYQSRGKDGCGPFLWSVFGSSDGEDDCGPDDDSIVEDSDEGSDADNSDDGSGDDDDGSDANAADDTGPSLPECYIHFLLHVLEIFDEPLRTLQSDQATVLELHEVMCNLVNQLKSRESDSYFGRKATEIMGQLNEE